METVLQWEGKLPSRLFVRRDGLASPLHLFFRRQAAVTCCGAPVWEVDENVCVGQRACFFIMILIGSLQTSKGSQGCLPPCIHSMQGSNLRAVRAVSLLAG